MSRNIVNARPLLYYKLDKKTHDVTPIDISELSSIFEQEFDNRIVGYDEIGKYRISTVFLSIDHQLFKGPPLLFETMIFGDDEEEPQVRYSTWKKANKAHRTAVAILKRGGSLDKAVAAMEKIAANE